MINTGTQVPLIVGVTSHRNLVATEVDGLRARVRELFTDLRQRYPELPLAVLSALAEGGDRLVAEEALACNAELVAVLPLPPALYRQDFANDESREQFDALCQQSEVLQMPLLPRNTAQGIAVPGEQRDAQYAEAGVFIASHCHILLAIWDGRDSDLYGGTAQIVRYHLDGFLPGTIERRRTGRPLFDRGDESLLCHLACSRAGPDAATQPPQPPLTPLEMRWISQQSMQPATAGIPVEFAEMFRRMVEFNTDQQRYRVAIAEHCLASDATPDDEEAEDRNIGNLFCACDWLAIHFQKRVLLAMRGIHVLAALMGIAFIAYSDLPTGLFDEGPLIDLFIVLFVAGFVLDRLAKRRAWHRKYIDYRALAEGLRVQRYWLMADIANDNSVAFAHDNFMQKQDIELGWIRNVMRGAGLQPRTRLPASAARLEQVITQWIGEPSGGGQLAYYARKCAERTRVAATVSRLGSLCLWVGIALGVTLALFHRWLDSDTSTYMVAIIGVLAIIAAARESYSYRKADRELIKQYRFMRQLFVSARQALDAEPEMRARREILHALGEAALAEHAEWALMHRERPLEHGRL